MADATVLILAVAFDLLLGEPPTFLHPVVWQGGVAALFDRFAPSHRAWLQFLYGAFAVLTGAALFGGAAYFVLGTLWEHNTLGYILISLFLLKGSFSVGALQGAAKRIKLLLEQGQLEDARYHMRDLVSRETSTLDQTLIAAATVESVAENITDSFVAPLFYFLLFGVPGAVVYRTVNTFDSMVGYRGEYEYLGKFAARLDDALNFIPARLSALLIILAARVVGRDSRAAWRIMRRDHSRTESPNAGWTMSAMAGALGVRLEKVGQYWLGDPLCPIGSQTIGEAIRLMQVVFLSWTGVLLAIEVIRFVIAAQT